MLNVGLVKYTMMVAGAGPLGVGRSTCTISLTQNHGSHHGLCVCVQHTSFKDRSVAPTQSQACFSRVVFCNRQIQLPHSVQRQWL
mmetsp:Transcript_18794/g.33762  ORF Transcript_18794/g.33762 Transcript_18794/m.33762 type:complete len:85 (-) Transcript_18794:15-269(-)